jgi:hypothetical protein
MTAQTRCRWFFRTKGKQMNANLRPWTAALLLGGWLGGSAFAGPVWICSITTAIASHEDGTTGEPDLGGLARPTFLKVDVEAKKVTILAPAKRRGEVSELDTVRQVGKTWILTGTEEDRVFSMVIGPDGHMTLTATADGTVWSVFGHAIEEVDIAPEKAPGK